MTTSTMPAPSTADASVVDGRTRMGTILVTGGASGLGAATVDAVRAAGAARWYSIARHPLTTCRTSRSISPIRRRPSER